MGNKSRFPVPMLIAGLMLFGVMIGAVAYLAASGTKVPPAAVMGVLFLATFAFILYGQRRRKH